MGDKAFIKKFLTISVPAVIQQLLSNLLQICDTMMIASLGALAISGVSVANKFFFIFTLLIYGLTNGIGLFIAQYYGARNKKEYNRIFRFGLNLCLATSAIFMIFLLIWPEITMNVFVQNQDIIDYGVMYIRIICYSHIPFAIVMMCGVAFRVKGDTNTPMIAGGISFFLNVFLNYLLIYGTWWFPKWGVSGAAVATLISRIVEMLILLLLLNRKQSDLKLMTRYLWLEVAKMKEIIKKALPLIGNELIWSLSLSVVFMNYCYVSEYYIPSLTIVDNISSLVYALFAGPATATGVIVGQALGGNLLEQAKRESKRMIKLGTAICMFGSLIVLVITPFVPAAFSLTGDLASMTIRLLIIKSTISWSQGYAETVYYILRAGGDTKGVLVVDGLFTCFGPLLISTVSARILQLDLLWIFILTEGIYLLKIVLSTYYYKKEHWVKSLT